MPFGLIFGAMFFFLGAWTGFRLLSVAGPQAKAAGFLMIVLGVTLMIGLLSRRPWARWIGVFGALGMATFALWRVGVTGASFDSVLLLAGIATAALLALPATSTSESAEASTAADPSTSPAVSSRVLPTISAVATVGLFAVAGWAMLSPTDAAAFASGAGVGAAQPVRDGRVAWADFGDGIDRARAENKLLLVNFNAVWCGYCTKMDQQTWSHPSVVERMNDVVAVRVDIEDQRRRNGYSGAEVARDYQVNGTPTQMLIDPSGRVVSRAGGYQTPRQLLLWLESSLGARGGNGAPVTGP